MSALGPPAGASGRKKSKAPKANNANAADGPSAAAAPAAQAERAPLSEHMARVYKEAAEKFPTRGGLFLSLPTIFYLRRVNKHWCHVLPSIITELRSSFFETASPATLGGLVGADVRLRCVELRWTDQWSAEKTQKLVALINAQATRKYLKELRLQAVYNRAALPPALVDAWRALNTQVLADSALFLDVPSLFLLAKRAALAFPHSALDVTWGELADTDEARGVLRAAFPDLRRLVAKYRWGHRLAALDGITHLVAEGGFGDNGLRKLMILPADDSWAFRIQHIGPLKIAPSLEVLCLVNAYNACYTHTFHSVVTQHNPADPFALEAITPADFASFLTRHSSLRLLVLGTLANLPFPIPDPYTDPHTAARVVFLPQGTGADRNMPNNPLMLADTSRGVRVSSDHARKLSSTASPAECRRCLEALLAAPALPPGSPAASSEDLKWAQKHVGTPEEGPTAINMRMAEGDAWAVGVVPQQGSRGVVGANVRDVFVDTREFKQKGGPGPALHLPRLKRVALHDTGRQTVVGVLTVLPDGSQEGQDPPRRGFLEPMLRGRRVASLEEAAVSIPADADRLAALDVLRHAQVLTASAAGGVTGLLQHMGELGALQGLVLRCSKTSKADSGELKRLIGGLPALRRVKLVGTNSNVARLVRQAVEGADRGVVFSHEP